MNNTYDASREKRFEVLYQWLFNNGYPPTLPQYKSILLLFNLPIVSKPTLYKDLKSFCKENGLEMSMCRKKIDLAIGKDL
jgi:antibiotic biosynthesis monooxygenase (ABM) superfamily enzyme